MAPAAVPDAEKTWDLLHFGWVAHYKRLDRFIAKFEALKRTNPRARALAVGRTDPDAKSAAQVARLRAAGVEVRGEVPSARAASGEDRGMPEIPGRRRYADLAYEINRAREVYLPASVVGGGERGVLEARSCGATVVVEPDNPKLAELADPATPLYDHVYYADRLEGAIRSVVR